MSDSALLRWDDQIDGGGINWWSCILLAMTRDSRGSVELVFTYKQDQRVSRSIVSHFSTFQEASSPIRPFSAYFAGGGLSTNRRGPENRHSISRNHNRHRSRHSLVESATLVLVLADFLIKDFTIRY
jgi:hypothetical protein